jgi:hypothetical protein
MSNDDNKPPIDVDLAALFGKLVNLKDVKMTVSFEILHSRNATLKKTSRVPANPDNPIMFSTVDEVREWLAEQHEPPDEGKT